MSMISTASNKDGKTTRVSVDGVHVHPTWDPRGISRGFSDEFGLNLESEPHIVQQKGHALRGKGVRRRESKERRESG